MAETLYEQVFLAEATGIDPQTEGMENEHDAN
ncbi:hypothetical protein U27_04431 [Candidatus Vecturithrix granuli]|uniref:Uncharacterized protein n=1 Tax=Vecturithrix granuli TaxID=1499967 RepID=A0A081BYQ9_VECG1|nr:hypothetical protein U27_04431 [Candidatus Vecturithrix granuli]